MGRTRAFSLLTGALLCAAAHAAPHALTPQQIAIVKAAQPNRPVSIPAPKSVFHWSTSRDAEHFEASLRKDGVFPLKTTRRSYFAMLHPEHDGRPALFSWSHPVTGLAFGASEIYGGAEAVTRLEIKPNARAVVLVSSEAGPHSPVSLAGVDLVLHVTKFERADGTVVPTLMEWIVLDPSAIVASTSEPAVLSRELAPWTQRIRRPGFALDLWDRHSYGSFFDGEHLSRSVLPLLERYLAKNTKAPRFRRALGQVAGTGSD